MLQFFELLFMVGVLGIVAALLVHGAWRRARRRKELAGFVQDPADRAE